MSAIGIPAVGELWGRKTAWRAVVSQFVALALALSSVLGVASDARLGTLGAPASGLDLFSFSLLMIKAEGAILVRPKNTAWATAGEMRTFGYQRTVGLDKVIYAESFPALSQDPYRLKQEEQRWFPLFRLIKKGKHGINIPYSPLFASLAALQLSGGNAYAWMHPGSPGGSIACPFPIDNGCAASPGGSQQIPSFFTGYTGSTYTKRPTANMAGVDYATGMPAITNSGLGICGLDTITDPANATAGTGCGQIPTGWKFDLPGITLNGAVTTFSSIHCIVATAGNCTGNYDFKGFELGPVGGHVMTVINWETGRTGNLTMEDNHHAFDYNSNTFAFMATQSHSPVTIKSSTMDGQWLSTYSDVGLFTGATAAGVLTVSSVQSGKILPLQILLATNLSNNTIIKQLTGTGGAACPDVTCDGTVGTYQIPQATVQTAETMQSTYAANGFAIGTTNNIDIEYIYETQLNGRPFNGQILTSSGGTSGTLFVGYSFFNGFPYTPQATCTVGCSGNVPQFIHGEIWQGTISAGQTTNAIIPSYIHSGITCYQSAAVTGANTACIYLSTGGNSQSAGVSTTMTDPEILNSVSVNQQAGINGGSTLSRLDRMFFGTLVLTGNFVSLGTTGQSVFCTQAPFVGGTLNHTITPYLNAPVVSGNFDMDTGVSYDSSWPVNDGGATGCLPF